MATGDLIKLGTLFTGGTKQLNPTRPWRGDTTVPGQSGTGNIPAFVAGQALEIRNTDPLDTYKIRWREVLVGSKKLLVADRNILHSVSWDDLNGQSLVTGKEITIDGQQYKLRLLTGGSNYRSGTDAYSGGTPTANEWDQIITGEANYPGLPKPTATDLDSSPDATDMAGAHNQYWNWFYMYTWAQETYTASGANRAIRGFSARSWGFYGSANRGATIGWRPVLEVLNSSPVISGDTQAQGNKTAPFTVNYQVTDPEGDVVSVVEKINTSTIKTEASITQGVNRAITLTNLQWADIPLNVESTITVEATDSKGSKSTRVFTFTKTNAAPTATSVEPKGDLANIAIVDTLTPIFVHKFNDVDSGDSQSAYQYIISNQLDVQVHDSGKKVSTQSFYQLPASVANWGDKLKWKVRVWDRFDVPSEYSFPEFFMPNRPPNVTNVQPGSADKLLPAGASLNPEITWSFEDLDLEAQAGFQVRIYKIADDVMVYDSSRINQNGQTHQVPTGRLAEGVGYYSVVSVWDPNDLKKDSTPAYFKTNATPSSPILTGPIDNYRTSLRPTFSGIVGTDPENDGQHFAIQIAEDALFTVGVLTYRSDTVRTGWQVNGFDIPVGGVFNDQQGQTLTYSLQVDLDRNKTYYWRMAAVDAGTTARGVYSAARKIRAGNELSFTLKNPINTAAVAARRILFAADTVIPTDGTTKATIKVEFSNNALDVTPTWENATAKFLAMDYYDFTNVTKTAGEFAIGVRVTIKSNDSLLPISIAAIGLTFD